MSVIALGLTLSVFELHDTHALPVYGVADTTPCPAGNPTAERTIIGIIWSCVLTSVLCAWTSVHPNIPPHSTGRALWKRVTMMFWAIIAPELILAWAVRQWFAAREIRNLYNRTKGKLPSRRWTLAHGHFVAMGGFSLIGNSILTLKEPERPDRGCSAVDREIYEVKYRQYETHRRRSQLGTLSFEHFQELVSDPNFEFPFVTDSDIQDRSKGDVLSKLLAIMQTTWFIIQCLARGIQRLALTELELTTVALASLNAVTYAFWWHKPLGAEEPIKLFIPKRIGRRMPTLKEEVAQHLTVRYVVDQTTKQLRNLIIEMRDMLKDPLRDGACGTFKRLFVGVPVLLFFILTFPLFVLFPIAIVVFISTIRTEPGIQESPEGRGFIAAKIVTALRNLHYRLASPISKFFEGTLKVVFDDGQASAILFNWYFRLPALFLLLSFLLIFAIPLFTFFFLISLVFTSVFAITTTSTLHSGHVPAFYCPRTLSDKYSRMVVFAFFGVLFGGLHCIGWHFVYPTPVERTLWRFTSSSITVIPSIVAPIDFYLEWTREQTEGSAKSALALRLLLDLIMTILLFAYVLARLSLIAQALALLRAQPPSVFRDVRWTQFIPHTITTA